MTKPRTTKSNPRSIPNLGPIETVPTALLKGYASNARTHDERQIALIAQSIVHPDGPVLVAGVAIAVAAVAAVIVVLFASRPIGRGGIAATAA